MALGSNQGDPLPQLKQAVAALAELLSELRLGPLFRSAPEGGAPGPPYLNSAVTGYSGLEPEMLLAAFKQLERRAGRRPAPRDAPRPLDLDLILCGSLESDRPELTLPHPRLRRRPFVLTPLAALAPEWRVPPEGETIAALARRAPGRGTIEPLAWGELEPRDRGSIDRTAAPL